LPAHPNLTPLVLQPHSAGLTPTVTSQHQDQKQKIYFGNNFWLGVA